MVWILLVVFISVIIFILLSRAIVDIKFLRNGDDDALIIKTQLLYGLIKLKKEISFVDIINLDDEEIDLGIKTLESDESGVGDSDVLSKNIENIFNKNELFKAYQRAMYYHKKYKTVGIYMKNKTVIDLMNWDSEIGVDEANVTAIITGVAWALKSNIFALTKKYFAVNKSSINIVPNYNRISFKTNLHCIIKVKIAHIINASIKLLAIKIKDGVRNEGTSN